MAHTRWRTRFSVGAVFLSGGEKERKRGSFLRVRHKFTKIEAHFQGVIVIVVVVVVAAVVVTVTSLT